MVLKYSSGRKTSVSYPKFLMEERLGRYLEPDETVDHIDCDFTNDDISNLRIIGRSKHTSNDVKRYKSQKFLCPECKEVFGLKGARLHNAIHNRIKDRAGPFCSRHCAGVYGKKIQMGGFSLEVELVVPEYTTNKELQRLEV